MQMRIAFETQPKSSRKDPATIDEQFCAELGNFQHETSSWRNLPRGHDLSSHICRQARQILPFLGRTRVCHVLRGCGNMQETVSGFHRNRLKKIRKILRIFYTSAVRSITTIREIFAKQRIYAAFRGTRLPFLRAFESPIAIACLRLFTLPPLPPLPLLALPLLKSCISFSTSFEALREYFLAISMVSFP
jgi:hypothetical protein